MIVHAAVRIGSLDLVYTLRYCDCFHIMSSYVYMCGMNYSLNIVECDHREPLHLCAKH